MFVVIGGQNMKKKIFFIAIIALAFVLTGCGKRTTYNEVTIDELTKMIEKKESFVLVIGSETCSACEAYKPTMEKVITNYNLKINYINIYPLTDEEKAKLITYAYYANTPTTVYFNDGVATDTHNRLLGAVSYETVVASLKKNGYIK